MRVGWRDWGVDPAAFGATIMVDLRRSFNSIHTIFYGGTCGGLAMVDSA